MTAAEEIKKASEARDYLTMVEVGYKAFGAGDVEALKEYFTMDCEMNPVFPVAGWKPVKGFEPMMEQFGAMATDANPGVQGFAPTPYKTELVGDKVLVFEDIKTAKAEFKGLAIHHFDKDTGKCYLCVPYHDSAKMS